MQRLYILASDIHIIPTGGLWDVIFRKTWINVNIFGAFGANGFQLNLAGLIIIIAVGALATFSAEKLVGEKPGKSMLSSVIFTLLGAYIFAGITHLPFEVYVENVPIFAALFGAIVFGVFFVLIKRAFTKSSKS